MKAEDLATYADRMVEAFNKALELRETAILKRIATLESRELVAGPPGKDGVDGQNGAPGNDAPPIDIKALSADIITHVVAEIPIPKDGKDGLNGKDAEPIDVKVMAENIECSVTQKVLAAIPAPIPGKDGKDGLTIKGDPGQPGEPGPAGKDGLAIKGDSGAPGETGPAGKDGINGKDAPPVDTKALGDEIVQKVLGQIPPPLHGKDGVDGKSVDIEAVRVLVSGEVIKAVSALPPALPGRDGIAGADGAHGLNGKDGRDGFSLKDFSVEPGEDGRTIVLKFADAATTVIEELTLPIPIYRDEYTRDRREEIKAYDVLTFGNETWIATVDSPTSDPGNDKAQWRRMARKGRDGRDRERPRDFSGTVKL